MIASRTWLQASVLGDNSVMVTFSDDDDEEDLASLAERVLFSKQAGDLQETCRATCQENSIAAIFSQLQASNEDGNK